MKKRIFIQWMGVRFISINDHYDSLDYKGTNGGLDVFIDRILIYDPKHIEIQRKLPDEVIKFIEG